MAAHTSQKGSLGSLCCSSNTCIRLLFAPCNHIRDSEGGE